MSETTTTTPDQTSQLSPLAELGAAFQAADDQQQKSEEEGRNGQPGAEPGNSDPSSPASSTPSSSSDAAKSREELLSSITLDEIKSHSTLGKQFKSEVDSSAARMLTGKTKEIESRIRQEVTMEQAKAHFDSLSQQDLADELAANPQAAELYGLIKATPPPAPPLDPTAAASIQYFGRMIREYDTKLNNSGLSPEVIKSLDPKVHLLEGRDPNLDSEAVLSKWISSVDQAIIDSKVKASGGSVDESNLIESNAARDERPGGALMTNGITTTPVPDFDKTSGKNLLADAFARSSRSTARR